MNFAFCRNSMVSFPFQAMASMAKAVLVNHAVKVQVYPTVAREELLAKTLGCKRCIWNHWLEDWTARENEFQEQVHQCKDLEGIVHVARGTRQHRLAPSRYRS
ncbi:helix-turn-helix domain-containing protein [Candidatus Bathyarchaeota archaeon]|nr:helix-turn-helix domain-containing protein [Candidatus Bathyarchaeota archaeon]